jgi:2-oxoglutarate ferredoxin oxidoreductase subunit alpha
VFLMADEVVGHMTERVTIPPADELHIEEPKRPKVPPGDGWLPYAPDEDLIPPMARAGEGYRIHVTGLTHDERGYPATNAEAQDHLVRRLVEKIRVHANEIMQVEEVMLADAEVAVVSYGSSARSARRAVHLAREQGLRAGLLRLITIWPFPGARIAELSGRVKALVVAETNLGQMVGEVERFSQRSVLSVTHAGGEALAPDPILDAIQEAIA